MSYHVDVVQACMANPHFRQELHTTPRAQLVLMCLQPGEDIGNEVHHLDQLLFFVAGTGRFEVDDQCGDVGPGHAVHVPAGTYHNFVNTGTEPMKLYTVYAPPEHAPGTVHRTKAEAQAAEAAELGALTSPRPARSSD
ncbi:MAG: cupin domain-containing protein [Candidatus Sericytochromatia bacterium]|nr:cupin domain-containing protein [Candidatus Sericytochromatia bacterium]